MRERSRNKSNYKILEAITTKDYLQLLVDVQYGLSRKPTPQCHSGTPGDRSTAISTHQALLQALTSKHHTVLWSLLRSMVHRPENVPHGSTDFKSLRNTRNPRIVGDYYCFCLFFKLEIFPTKMALPSKGILIPLTKRIFPFQLTSLFST